jgi:hypothetical protein
MVFWVKQLSFAVNQPAGPGLVEFGSPRFPYKNEWRLFYQSLAALIERFSPSEFHAGQTEFL